MNGLTNRNSAVKSSAFEPLGIAFGGIKDASRSLSLNNSNSKTVARAC